MNRGGGRVPVRRGSVSDAHVGAYHEAAAFNSCGAKQRQPGFTTVSGRGEVEVDVLGVEGLSHQGHVVFPADGGCEVNAYPADGRADRAEGSWRALSPDEPLGSSLKQRGLANDSGGQQTTEWGLQA